MSTTPITPAQLLKSALLPALWILALPAVSLTFAAYVESRWDAMVSDAILQSVEQDASLDEAGRAEGRAFAAAFSAAEACGSDDEAFAPIRGQLGELCDDYAQMRWMRLGSVGLSTGLSAGSGYSERMAESGSAPRSIVVRDTGADLASPMSVSAMT